MRLLFVIYFVENKLLKCICSCYYFLNRMASVNSKQNATRKELLDQLTKVSGNMKRLADMIDTYVECTSFISNREEINGVLDSVNSFNTHRAKLQAYFDELNSGLYELSEDTDVLPCFSQDPDCCLETETFKEKKELSVRVVTKTRMYVENPVFLESALAIADNEPTYIEASKFLRKQFNAVQHLLFKFFPEEEPNFPLPGEGLTCTEIQTFEKIRMPLIHILDYFCSKFNHKCVANADFHDNVYSMFKKINAKYERLFSKTCHKDEGWLNMMKSA